MSSADRVEAWLAWLGEAPAWLVYAVVGGSAALENLVPPVPADLTILAGGVVAGLGAVRLGPLFLLVWSANVFGALVVYGIGRRYGPAFFGGRWGRLLLRPGQLGRLQEVYHRRGFVVLFVSRFLPVFRSVVPVFAGVARIGPLRTAVPIALASGLWYGGILYAGAVAGENWRDLLALIERAGRWFWIGAALVALIAAAWWWRSR
jgi:membrane protein DedA with SNARE-associated domain